MRRFDRTHVLPTAAIALSLVAVLAVWGWASAECFAPGSRIAFKETAPHGCFEYWFNRWQSALGGSLALAAAFIGGRYAIHAARISAEPENNQLQVARVQAAIVSLPILNRQIIAINAEQSARDEFRQSINNLDRFLTKIQTGKKSVENVHSMTIFYIERIEEYGNYYLKSVTDASYGLLHDDIRAEAAGTIDDFRSALGETASDLIAPGPAAHVRDVVAAGREKVAPLIARTFKLLDLADSVASSTRLALTKAINDAHVVAGLQAAQTKTPS